MSTSSQHLAATVGAFVAVRSADSTFSLREVLSAVQAPVDVEHVVAVLWDLVEDGALTYGSDALFTVRNPRLLLVTA